MASYKVNYFFKQRDFGWSETFYVPELTSAVALIRAKSIIPSRVALLGGIVASGSSPFLKEVRISNIAIQRDSLIYRVPAADGVPPNPIGTADNPQLCIELSLRAGDLYRRSLFVSGQPDSLITSDGIYVPQPLWESQLDTWAKAITANFFSILVTTKPAGDLPLINEVVLAPGGKVQITSAAPHGLVNQDPVRIVSAPGVKGITGNWRVAVLDATNFILLGATMTGAYVGGGKFYKRVPSLQNINTALIIGAAKKSRGRPFDSPVGRRRRRVRA